MTDGIIKFMYTEHNGGNAKLKIFLYIPQRQRIQPNVITDSIRTFKHTEITKHTNNTLTTKTTTSKWVSLVTQNLCSYN